MAAAKPGMAGSSGKRWIRIPSGAIPFPASATRSLAAPHASVPSASYDPLPLRDDERCILAAEHTTPLAYTMPVRLPSRSCADQMDHTAVEVAHQVHS